MDAGAWDERYAASERVWSADPNGFVAAECADLPAGRAVDVACGEGRNALWLAARGWDVLALDFSRVGIDKGRAAPGGDAVRWAVDDATTWEADERFDLALLCYLQLAADERRAAVQRAAAALAPGGTLLVVAHDSSNLAEGTGGPQDPAVLMTAGDVLGDLEAGGLLASFDVERAERVARHVAVDDPHGGSSTATAWDCLVRARRR